MIEQKLKILLERISQSDYIPHCIWLIQSDFTELGKASYNAIPVALIHQDEKKSYIYCSTTGPDTLLYLDEVVEEITIDEFKSRMEYLENLINNPEINDFLEGTRLESAHQTERWGQAHEESKYPHDYALVLDKLKGKQALAIWDKDIEKYKHHLITMSAVCYNIHRQIDKPGTALNRYFHQTAPPSPQPRILKEGEIQPPKI